MRSKDVDTKKKKVNKKTAAKLLQEDILNSAIHCFGSHHKCKADYCKTVKAVASSDNVAHTDKHSLPVSQSPDISMQVTSSSFTSGSNPDTPSTSF